MAFSIHPNPDHIHIETTCGDHFSNDCTEGHWIGGRPEKDHPHKHIEIDCSTGLVGYTRRSKKEIEEWKQESIRIVKEQEVIRQQQENDIFILKEAAKTDDRFTALLRHLGIKEI